MQTYSTQIHSMHACSFFFSVLLDNIGSILPNYVIIKMFIDLISVRPNAIINNVNTWKKLMFDDGDHYKHSVINVNLCVRRWCVQAHFVWENERNTYWMDSILYTMCNIKCDTRTSSMSTLKLFQFYLIFFMIFVNRCKTGEKPVASEICGAIICEHGYWAVGIFIEIEIKVMDRCYSC